MQGKNPPTRIAIVPATREQRPIVANLLELYAHDFSEFHDVELGEDGRFGYPDLSHYWSEPDRFPFLVRINDKLAGVILVRKGSRISGNKTPGTWRSSSSSAITGGVESGLTSHTRCGEEFPEPGRFV